MAWLRLTMVRLVSFFRLQPAERALLVRSALTLASIKLALLLLTFATSRRLIDRMKRRSPKRGSSLARERIVRSVARASHFIPGARNCLVRAIAAELMLARAGYPSEVKFGVAKDALGQFA